jgi:hypothetical protein
MSDPDKPSAVIGFLIGVIGILATLVALVIGELYGLINQ